MPELLFTGERYVPGRTNRRIASDHVARYSFALSFVKNQRVLDIACGTGFGSSMCAQGGAVSVDGVDLSVEAVEFATRSYQHPKLRFVVGDIATYASHVPYDLIICYETIEHLVDYDSALLNLRSLLTPGGTLLISSPNRQITSPKSRSFRDDPKNPFHAHEFTLQELQGILWAHGFEVPPAGIYGQRQQWTIQSTVLRRAYERLFASKWTTSAQVTPVANKTPRYYVLAATKYDETRI